MIFIAGFEVTEKVYESSRSLILRAIRERDKLPVIIKVLNSRYPEPEQLARFRREFELTSRFNSELIVRAYEIHPYRNSLMIVLEDFGGVSLAKILEEKSSASKSGEPVKLFELRVFLNLAIQITAVLEEIHNAGIIHKDINPSNLVWNSEKNILKLIDFGISTELNQENSGGWRTNQLEGTLHYISPEQTGRINRLVDYRADFYSLGVSFYELLTGVKPFEGNDSMELVYCHIAKLPSPIQKYNPDIPPALIKIISRLMEKNPEKRYQSYRGLSHDLRHCLTELESDGVITNFEVGQEDLGDTFLISQKLYGRDAEIQNLIKAFERTARGERELVLVKGFSGIGKTALVREIHRPVVERRGYFISGKFEKLSRNTPYRSLIQALGDLARRILTENEERILEWRNKLLTLLGPNIRLIIDVVPEIGLLTGEQPEVPVLTSRQEKNRFEFTLRKFIHVFSSREHPLVLFLDDLQWADNSSLDLLNGLLRDPGSSFLLLIGAYRDNEVGPEHFLLSILKKLEDDKFTITEISPKPLRVRDVAGMLGETLRCELDEVEPLSRLCFKKTGGNPFFLSQFLKNLYTQKLLYFQSGENPGWRWDLAKIQNMDLADNVGEFMAGRIKSYSSQAQATLSLAACIGSRFDLTTLLALSEYSRRDVSDAIWQFLKDGLIQPLDSAYRYTPFGEDVLNARFGFLHDRVREAAYEQFSIEHIKLIHLRLGRILLEEGEEARDGENGLREKMPASLENIFDIVNHINFAVDLLEDEADQVQAARLNLVAARRARMSAAFTSALVFVMSGVNLLPEKSWSNYYDITLSLYVESCELLFLTDHYEQLKEHAEIVFDNARDFLDTIPVHETLNDAEINQGHIKTSIKLGVEVLNKLGFPLRIRPGKLTIIKELILTRIKIARMKEEKILALPENDDPRQIAIIKIATKLSNSAYVAGGDLYASLVFKRLRLSLTYGLTPASIAAFSSYSVILCGVLGKYDEGYALGGLSLQLLERMGDKAILQSPRILFLYNGTIRHWKEHLGSTLDELLRVYRICQEIGDVIFDHYSKYFYFFNSYILGRDLKELEAELNVYLEGARGGHFNFAYYALHLLGQVIENLTGKSENPRILEGSFYTRKRAEELDPQADQVNLFYINFFKAWLNYLFGKYELARESIRAAKKIIGSVRSQPAYPILYYYEAMIELALLKQPSFTGRRKSALKTVKANLKRIRKYAAAAPENFEHRLNLVLAELAWLENRRENAIDHYELAALQALRHEYYQEAALARELAGRFWLSDGKYGYAEYNLELAYHQYRVWGASALTAHLSERYGDYLRNYAPGARGGESLYNGQITTEPSGGQTRTVGDLDMVSVLKSTLALSSELKLDRLLLRMMEIIMENAGALRGAFAEKVEDDFRLDVLFSVDNNEFVREDVSDDESQICVAALRYVLRTGEILVLDDAQNVGEFVEDENVRTLGIISLLCIPVFRKDAILGALYLENNRMKGAFTGERIETLRIIMAQAAISLDNARLFEERFITEEALRASEERYRKLSEELEERVVIRTAELKAVNHRLEATNKELESFSYSVSHDLRAPLRHMDGYSQALTEDYGDVLDEHGLKYLSRIRAAGARMNELIEDLLRLSRVTSLRELNIVELSPGELAESICEPMRSAGREGKVEFIINTEVRARADAGLLRSVLENLLGNAWKYTSKNLERGRGTRIEFGLLENDETGEREDNEAVYFVRDNGAGFDMKQVEKLFGVFQRLHRDDEFEGSGVGLATVQRIIHRHGGQIWARGEPEGGAAFYFTLGKHSISDN